MTFSSWMILSSCLICFINLPEQNGHSRDKNLVFKTTPTVQTKFGGTMYILSSQSSDFKSFETHKTPTAFHFSCQIHEENPGIFMNTMIKTQKRCKYTPHGISFTNTSSYRMPLGQNIPRADSFQMLVQLPPPFFLN